MKRHSFRLYRWIAMLLLPLGLAAAEPRRHLLGQVQDGPATGPLAQRLHQVGAEGSDYLAAYAVPMRRGQEPGDKADKGKRGFHGDEKQTVSCRDGRIVIDNGHGGVNLSCDDKDTAPRLTVLLLCRRQGGRLEIRDLQPLGRGEYEFRGTTAHWLGECGAEESFRLLQTTPLRVNDEEHLVMVRGLHDCPAAVAYLEQTARGTGTEKVRGAALFWLGAMHDQAGRRVLAGFDGRGWSDKMMEHLVFACYISGGSEMHESIIRIARHHESAHVRSNAVFWLGQAASQRCVETLGRTVGDDPDLKVRRAAVFAISQLPKEKSVPQLIAIARDNKDGRLRKEAIFWLGQTDSPQALDFLEKMLTGK